MQITADTPIIQSKLGLQTVQTLSREGPEHHCHPGILSDYPHVTNWDELVSSVGHRHYNLTTKFGRIQILGPYVRKIEWRVNINKYDGTIGNVIMYPSHIRLKILDT